MIDARRVRRWIAGRDPNSLTEENLCDIPPVAKVRPYKLTEGERAGIVKAARDKKLAHLRHRKLTHTLPQGRCPARRRARSGCSGPRASCPSITTARARSGRAP